MNILFTNAGRRTYLIEYALDLKKQNFDINVFVSDSTYCTAAMYVSTDVKTFITPRVDENEEKYVESLLWNCINFNINVVIPLMDFELLILAKNKSLFEKNDIKIWISDFDTIINCLDKRKNYFFCEKNNIPIPRSWFTVSDISTPVIKKKIKGSGSVGMQKILPGESFSFLDDEDMLQEFINGREVGMDIFNDYNGNFIHACFREKILMRAGETDKAKSFDSQVFMTLAKSISETFRHIGNMDIDFIETESGEIFFIDFNPRFGGGYPFTHNSGPNYLKFIIEDGLGLAPCMPTFIKSITGMKGLVLHYF